MLPMVVKSLEEFDNGASDVFNIGVGRRPHHWFKYFGGGEKGGGYLVRG